MPFPTDGETGDASLYEAVSTAAPITAVPVPQSQPSFDTAGTFAGSAKDILTSGAQLVTSIAGGLGSIVNAGSDARANQAISDQQRRIALQQSNTAAVVADYQNKTAIAQAQAMFNKAAGVVSSQGFLLALAGGLAVLLFVVKGKR